MGALAESGPAEDLRWQLLRRQIDRRRLLLSGAAAGATLGLGSLLAACGGDDDDDDSEAPAATATTGGGAPTATSGAAATSAPAEGEPKAGGTLTMSLADGDATNFDPIIPTDNMSIWTMLLIYDQVIRVGPDGLSVEPGLAENWEAAPDGLSYTFTLRDATFHDGTTVTAQDCVYCLNRAVTDEKSQWAWIFSAVDKHEAVDDKTMKSTLKQVWVPFPSDLSLYAASIFPQAAHEAQAEALFESPIGSGPFKWVSWEKEVQIELEKNPSYWTEGQPYLDKLTFKVLTDANNRMLQFQSGELDIATDAPFSQLDALRQNADVAVLTDAVARTDYIGINNKNIADVKVRQAINYAVDKDAIIANVLFGAGELCTSYLPKMLYWNPNLEGYPYDLEKAKQLMAESTMADGFDAEFIIGTGDPVTDQVAQLVASNLKEIGINVTLTQLEGAASNERIRAYEYDLYKGYFTTDIIDPDELTTFCIASDGGTEVLWTGYKNEEVDRLAHEAVSMTDEDARRDAYYKIQELSTADAPYLYLYYPSGRTAVHKYIENFKILPTGNYRLWETWRNDV